MRIQSKYLLWVNGVLLLLWTLYIVTDQAWDSRDLLRIEAHYLQSVARVVRGAGFSAGEPSKGLTRLLNVLTQVHPGIEVMVLDRRSVVRASSVAGRVGRRWREKDIDQVLARGETAKWQYQDHFHGGMAMLDVTLPVAGPAGPPTYAIHIARRMELVNQLLREHRARNVLWAVASMVLIGVLLTLGTYRWMIRPVKQMTDTLAQSRWYQPARRRGDELQRLGTSMRRLVRDAEQAMGEKEDLLRQVRSFNEKLAQEVRNVRDELTAAQAELVRRERLSAVGTLATALAHELRNPLHIIRGDAELLARRQENRETCTDILEEVDRINRFVNELLDYTRPIEPQPGQAEVAAVVRSAVAAVSRTEALPSVNISVECPEELELRIDTEHLRQILVNLASNAVQSMPEGGRLVIRAGRVDGRVDLEVEDTGTGIRPEDMERVFEPFFTRRPAGTGLGLAIVKRLADLYGAELVVRSTPGQGTTVALRFEEQAALERTGDA